MPGKRLKKVVIVGAGGLGRETLWLLRDQIRGGEKTEIAGFIDDAREKIGAKIAGLKVLGNSRWLMERLEEFEVVLAVGEINAKKRLAEKLQGQGAKFRTVIHPQVNCSPDASVGEGTIIFPQVALSANVRVGKFVLLNPGITLSHDVEIGDYSLIGSGAHLAGAVKVGEECEIGTGANLIPRVKVGAGTIIGAGATVLKDLPANVVAVGVPARVIKARL